MNTRTIVLYSLAGLAVVILGALVGWYLFLHSQTQSTATLNAGRGFGAETPAGGAAGNGSSALPAGAVGTTTVVGKAAPRLWHVAQTPVGGIGFATTSAGVELRYVDRATGYIFAAHPDNAKIERLVNELVPKIYEASFASSDRVVERSLDASGGVVTYVGTLHTASSTLTKISLSGITAIAADPKSRQFFYIKSTGSGVGGFTAQWDGSKQKQIFSSSLPGWRAWWLADGRIILSQNAADDIDGYAYSIKGGLQTGLVGPLPGLTVRARSGSSGLIYGTSSGGALALFARVSATSSAKRLSIPTIADKCVWAPGQKSIAYCAVPQTQPASGFLDAWYRGEAHTRDAVWRVDASAGQAEILYTPGSDTLDVVDPTVDESGEYLAFVNGVDLTPWILRIAK